MKKLLLLVFIPIVNSCQTASDFDKIDMQIDRDALSLSLDNESPNISSGLVSYNSQGVDFLFSVNWTNNSLNLYNIDSQSFVKNIEFDPDGPEGTGRILGIHVHTFDSIFLFTQGVNEIVLADTSGRVVSRIQYDPPYPLTNAFVHNAYFLSPPVIQQDEMIVKSHIEGNYREMTQQNLSEIPLSYAIDLKTGVTREIKANYPSDYMPDGLKSFEYSMAYNGQEMVYSFIGDHRLFISDGIDASALNAIQAKSQYLQESLPLFPINGAREDTYQYLYASDRYESLLFDPFRNVFYRIAVPAMEVESDDEYRSLRIASQQFSILVLDNELRVIGEVLLEKEKYVAGNVFVGKEGLYISTNHPRNPQNAEDVMSFDRLKLSID